MADGKTCWDCLHRYTAMSKEPCVHCFDVVKDKGVHPYWKAIDQQCELCEYATKKATETPCDICYNRRTHPEFKQQECGTKKATAHNRDCKMVASSCKMSRHKAICDGIHDLYERKNHDYGDSFGQSFRDHGILAGVIRIEDKFNRLKTLAGGSEQKVQDESIRDTLRDMANYAIMTLLEMEVQNEENQSH